MREVAATLSVMALLIVLAVGWPRPSELVAKDAHPTDITITATPTFPGRYVPPRPPTDQLNG
jgi:hypothetical protein